MPGKQTVEIVYRLKLCEGKNYIHCIIITLNSFFKITHADWLLNSPIYHNIRLSQYPFYPGP